MGSRVTYHRYEIDGTLEFCLKCNIFGLSNFKTLYAEFPNIAVDNRVKSTLSSSLFWVWPARKDRTGMCYNKAIRSNDDHTVISLATILYWSDSNTNTDSNPIKRSSSLNAVLFLE
jgi:hypothetical protein